MAFNFFKKSKSKEESKEKPSNVPQYFDLKVTDVVQETSDAISIVFEQPNTPISYKSGQFLTLIADINGKEVRRAYSLCSSPFTERNLAVAVKRVEQGIMSNWLAENLKAGDTLKIMEPMGVFTTEYDTANRRHFVMFAGGSGITPMLSIMKSMLTQEPESKVTLVYANRNANSIIFKTALEQLEATYQDRFKTIHVLDAAPEDWQGPAGLLSPEILQPLYDEIPDKEGTTFLLCGPQGMMHTVEAFLETQNVPKDRIMKESFVSDAAAANGTEAKAAGEGIVTREVTVIYDGEKHKFEVEPSSTILETALDRGIDLPYSCQSGLCTACRGKCLSGKVKLDEEEGLSEEEMAEGYVLTCVGHPLTDDVVIEIG